MLGAGEEKNITDLESFQAISNVSNEFEPMFCLMSNVDLRIHTRMEPTKVINLLKFDVKIPELYF